MPDDAARLRRRAEREHNARLQAEDIAERAIADLSATNARLDRLVEERTRELREALSALEVADRTKTEFLRGIAHEIATPTHALRGFVELATTDSTDPGLRWAAAQADAAADRLLSALRTLLEFAAVAGAHPELHPRPTALTELSEAAVARWTPAAIKAGALLTDHTGRELPTVVVDPIRVDQVLDALLDNAIRFGGRHVELTTTVAHADGLRARFEVADRGPGFPEHLRDSAFDAFVRGDGTHDGFGIGLTLARQITHALGGTLELVGDGAPGAHLVVDIPVVPADPAPGHETSASAMMSAPPPAGDPT